MAPSSPHIPVSAPATFAVQRPHGRLAGARWCPSPNCNPRPDPDDISLVVVHGISLPPGQFGAGLVADFFCNCLDTGCHPALGELAGVTVSAHLFIDRAGQVSQFVDFAARAWHAGASHWQGRDNCNDFAIGIELEGTDNTPYSEAQYSSLAAVCQALFAAYPALAAERVVGHCDIAPGRKTDPGPAFDWPRLRGLLA